MNSADLFVHFLTWMGQNFVGVMFVLPQLVALAAIGALAYALYVVLGRK